ncbi:MAG TPA: DUF4157 domain-containing protein [Acidimicrobiales bacterium]|nr:DUF4157 domain-containing protein [Acidimicrobiales bacterium]
MRRRAVDGHAIGAPAAPPVAAAALRAGGVPLDGSTRASLEPRFGRDLGAVRVHSDSVAAAGAAAVGARAYTVGAHIVFGAGQYAPATAEGRRLLAHELTHVLQQGPVAAPGGSSLEVGAADSPFEREADRVADAVVRGLDLPVVVPGGPPALRRACGEAAIGPPPPGCNLTFATPSGARFLFNRACDDWAPGQQAAFESAVDAVVPGATVNLFGIASTDGPVGFNLSLSCARLAEARAIVVAKGKSGQLRRSEAVGPQGLAGDVTFRAVAMEVIGPAPPPPPAATTTRTFEVVVKSFIRTIGTTAGAMFCPTFLGDPFVGPTARLQGLAVATDLMFSETAPTAAKDTHYRLFSRRTFTLTCRHGVPVSARASALDTDVGLEGPLVPPPLIIFTDTVTPTPTGGLHFSWSGEGRPHLAAEPAFQSICPRLSVFIWHHIEGDVDCGGVRITAFSGSRFPSRRAYVDGVVTRDVHQGTFNRLWESAPGAPTRVR